MGGSPLDPAEAPPVADAVARISTGLSAMAVTYGAGALNSVNAIAGAYAERSPLFVIAGCPSESERGSGFLLHHRDGRFVLIEVMIPAGTVSPTLARFAKRLKERRAAVK